MYITTRKQLEEIGRIVISKAHEIFEECGTRSDFCIQYIDIDIGLESAVFGGTNRLLWNPVDGFRLDESYCTEKFKNLYKQRRRITGQGG